MHTRLQAREFYQIRAFLRSWFEPTFRAIIADQHVCAPADADVLHAQRDGYRCPECGAFVPPKDQLRI